MNQNIQKIFVLVAAGLAHEVALGMDLQQTAQQMQVPQYDTQRTQRTSSTLSRSGVDSDGNGDYVDFSDGDDDTEERKFTEDDVCDRQSRKAQAQARLERDRAAQELQQSFAKLDAFMQQHDQRMNQQEQDASNRAADADSTASDAALAQALHEIDLENYKAHQERRVTKALIEADERLKKAAARNNRSFDALEVLDSNTASDTRHDAHSRESARHSRVEGKENARRVDVDAPEAFEAKDVDVEVKENSSLSTATKVVAFGATVGGIGYAASKPEVRRAFSDAKDACRQS